MKTTHSIENCKVCPLLHWVRNEDPYCFLLNEDENKKPDYLNEIAKGRDEHCPLNSGPYTIQAKQLMPTCNKCEVELELQSVGYTDPMVGKWECPECKEEVALSDVIYPIDERARTMIRITNERKKT